MKPIALSILALAFLASQAFGADRITSRKYLPSVEDDFYSQYGGRVFHIRCPNRRIFIWKNADGQPGMYDCRTGNISPNAKIVRRGKRGWVPYR